MSYTKKELLKCLENVSDDAVVEINIVSKVGDGTEEGQLFEIEAVGFIAPAIGFPGGIQIVGYDISEADRAKMNACLAEDDAA